MGKGSLCVAGLFLLLCALGITGLRSEAQARRSVQVSGTFLFTEFGFTGPTTAAAETIVVGDLAGTASAQYYNIVQKGKGVFHLNGTHTIVTAEGTLTTFDEIRLQFDQKNPTVARANSRLYIVDGTGAFEGASGVLHTHGELDAVTLEGGIDFKGRIYLP
jgi:hypothetical protein